MRSPAPWTGSPPIETCTARYGRVRCEARPDHPGGHRGRDPIGGQWVFWGRDELDPVAKAKADLEALLARRAS